ncbi:MAG: tyrosine-type recombinase/integrase [Coriobacteriia bacterium]
MRRARDGVRDLGDGRFRVDITVGYDPATGHQVRKSRTVRCTPRQLAERIEQLHREYGTVDAVFYGSMSVPDFIEVEYWPTRKLEETTKRGYDATLKNHVRPLFGRMRMKDANSHAIGRALSTISHAGARLNAWKMLRAVFAYALASGIVDTNPMMRIPKPELEDYEADIYDLSEVLSAFEAVYGLDFEPGVLIAFSCGTRASETCAIDWQDLDMVRIVREGEEDEYIGSLPVDDSYHRLPGKRLTKDPKTKRSDRVIAIPGFVVKRLMEIRGDIGGGPRRIGPLMVDRTGQRMTPDGFSHRWRRLTTERTNKRGEVIYSPPIRHIELKNARHSQSTILLDEGATMHDVAVRDGHSRDSTTDDLYTKRHRRADHHNAKRLDDAAGALTRAKEASVDVARRGRA